MLDGYLHLLARASREPASPYDFGGQTEGKWWAWHQENPWVWREFEALSLEMAAVRDRYSAWSVIGKLRWEYDLRTTGPEFKITNDYIAYYSRLFMHLHPQHEGFFQTKPFKDADA